MVNQTTRIDAATAWARHSGEALTLTADGDIRLWRAAPALLAACEVSYQELTGARPSTASSRIALGLQIEAALALAGGEVRT